MRDADVDDSLNAGAPRRLEEMCIRDRLRPHLEWPERGINSSGNWVPIHMTESGRAAGKSQRVNRRTWCSLRSRSIRSTVINLSLIHIYGIDLVVVRECEFQQSVPQPIATVTILFNEIGPAERPERAVHAGAGRVHESSEVIQTDAVGECAQQIKNCQDAISPARSLDLTHDGQFVLCLLYTSRCV